MGGVEGIEVIVRILSDCVLGGVEGTEVIVMTLPEFVVVMTMLLAIRLLVANPLAEKKNSVTAKW